MQFNLNAPSRRSTQAGMSMVVVLIMLSAIFVIVAFGARIALLGERSARNDRDRQVAYQAAEAALGDAEIDIMGPNTGANRRDSFLNAKTSASYFPFPSGSPTWLCGIGRTTTALNPADLGLCGLAPGSPASAALTSGVFSANPSDSNRGYVQYGELTNRSVELPTGSAGLPILPPRYVIEYVGYYLPDQNAQSPVRAFRVTALGYGLSLQTTVALQSIVYKPQ